MMRNPRMAVFAAAMMLFSSLVMVRPSRAVIGSVPLPSRDPDTIGEPDTPPGRARGLLPIGHVSFIPVLLGPSGVVFVPAWTPRLGVTARSNHVRSGHGHHE